MPLLRDNRNWWIWGIELYKTLDIEPKTALRTAIKSLNRGSVIILAHNPYPFEDEHGRRVPGAGAQRLPAGGQHAAREARLKSLSSHQTNTTRYCKTVLAQNAEGTLMLDTNQVMPKQLDRLIDLAVFILGLIFAIYLRVVFREFESVDFILHTSRWYAAVLDQGLGATASDVSNYTPAYLYLLNIVSILFPNLAPVIAIKIPSCVFDFLCAGLVFAITRLKYPSGRVSMFAFLAVLLAPTVVANSAIWGQADSIYTSMLLVCVYCLITHRPAVAMLAFGVALSLKFQAMFLAPAIFVLWLRRHVPFWTLLLVPVVYTALMIPAWLEGRPFSELMLVYFGQSQTYHKLTMNAPNLYSWIPNRFYSPVVIAGLLLMTAIGSLFAWLVWRSRVRLDEALTLKLCTLSLIMTPFFLPKMHDRFFFPADVLTIAYGFFFPRQYYVPIVVGFAFLFAYSRFLLKLPFVPIQGLALVMLFALVAVAWATVLDLKGNGDQVPDFSATH